MRIVTGLWGSSKSFLSKSSGFALRYSRGHLLLTLKTLRRKVAANEPGAKTILPERAASESKFLLVLRGMKGIAEATVKQVALGVTIAAVAVHAAEQTAPVAMAQAPIQFANMAATRSNFSNELAHINTVLSSLWTIKHMLAVKGRQTADLDALRLESQSALDKGEIKNVEGLNDFMVARSQPLYKTTVKSSQPPTVNWFFSPHAEYRNAMFADLVEKIAAKHENVLVVFESAPETVFSTTNSNDLFSDSLQLATQNAFQAQQAARQSDDRAWKIQKDFLTWDQIGLEAAKRDNVSTEAFPGVKFVFENADAESLSLAAQAVAADEQAMNALRQGDEKAFVEQKVITYQLKNESEKQRDEALAKELRELAVTYPEHAIVVQRGASHAQNILAMVNEKTFGSQRGEVRNTRDLENPDNDQAIRDLINSGKLIPESARPQLSRYFREQRAWQLMVSIIEHFGRETADTRLGGKPIALAKPVIAKMNEEHLNEFIKLEKSEQIISWLTDPNKGKLPKDLFIEGNRPLTTMQLAREFVAQKPTTPSMEAIRTLIYRVKLSQLVTNSGLNYNEPVFNAVRQKAGYMLRARDFKDVKEFTDWFVAEYINLAKVNKEFLNTHEAVPDTRP
ncbi:MAG: hypothetical protein HOP33_06810 [Verrucomicrobia bacterium]|nr:hypothetical protein [Verrucomicrobiota bacterium]